MVNTDSKTIAIAALAMLLIPSVAVAPSSVKVAPTGNIENVEFPPGINNWTSIFRGYPAFLDNRIGHVLINGASMAPTYTTNDEILWVAENIENIEIGDIILFTMTSAPDRPLVAHRVIAYRPEGVLTQGDGNDESDKWTIGENELHGLVIGTLFKSSTGWHYP